MTITNIQRNQINKMNKASQNPLLGTIIQNLQNETANISSGSAKFGDSQNYSYFTPSGSLVFSGSATVYRDIIMPAINLRPGGTPPTFGAFTDAIYSFGFAASTADELHGSAEIQHDYKEGTSIEVHCHWSPNSTNVGGCAWKFEYSIANVSGSFPPSTTLVPTSGSSSTGITNSHIITNLGVIPGTIAGSPIKIGAVIAYRIYRDGNTDPDTFTGVSFLHSVGIHYICDTIGSNLPLSK